MHLRGSNEPKLHGWDLSRFALAPCTTRLQPCLRMHQHGRRRACTALGWLTRTRWQHGSRTNVNVNVIVNVVHALKRDACSQQTAIDWLVKVNLLMTAQSVRTQPHASCDEAPVSCVLPTGSGFQGTRPLLGRSPLSRRQTGRGRAGQWTAIDWRDKVDLFRTAHCVHTCKNAHPHLGVRAWSGCHPARAWHCAPAFLAGVECLPLTSDRTRDDGSKNSSSHAVFGLQQQVRPCLVHLGHTTHPCMRPCLMHLDHTDHPSLHASVPHAP